MEIASCLCARVTLTTGICQEELGNQIPNPSNTLHDEKYSKKPATQSARKSYSGLGNSDSRNIIHPRSNCSGQPQFLVQILSARKYYKITAIGIRLAPYARHVGSPKKT